MPSFNPYYILINCWYNWPLATGTDVVHGRKTQLGLGLPQVWTRPGVATSAVYVCHSMQPSNQNTLLLGSH